MLFSNAEPLDIHSLATSSNLLECRVIAGSGGRGRGAQPDSTFGADGDTLFPLFDVSYSNEPLRLQVCRSMGEAPAQADIGAAIHVRTTTQLGPIELNCGRWFLHRRSTGAC